MTTYSTDERVAWVKGAMSQIRTFADNALKKLYDIHMDAVARGADPNGYNGVGYAPFDRDLMCTCAEVLKHGGTLSPKQRKEVQERLLKYAGQLVADIEKRKMLPALDARISESLGLSDDPKTASTQEATS